ncbi:MAG: hypothetical protein WCE23_00790 [Candidatus Binatus sp.]|uniref:hypothetical protein n=1 Tax=Candidatus Binatus sp. TaxID=2811406 RepID=UPI003C737FC1
MKAIKRGFFRRIGAPGVAFLALTAALVLAGPQAAWAKKAHASVNAVDPTAVSACGQSTAASNTIYYLTANLTEASDSASCIVLSGSNSALNLYGYNITGPGDTKSTAYGIEITGTHTVVEGFNSVISGFMYGIYDNGTQDFGDDVNVTENVDGLVIGSTNHTHDWSNFAAYSNTANGVWMDGCQDDCFLTDFLAYDNGTNGLLLHDTTGAAVSVFIAADNGTNGVELDGTNSGAVVADAYLTDLTFIESPYTSISGNTENGIYLASGESNDQVTTAYADGNGNDTAYFDLRDGNASCGSDLWFNNTFTTAEANTTKYPTATCFHGLGD